jgi:O-antigen biosynthesis protein WbqP
MNRFSNILLAILVLIFFMPLMVLVGMLVRISSKGPVLYWSNRIGRNSLIFSMPKFRTMYIGTPQVATHSLGNPENYLTPLGRWLRKASIDELPQIWSVIIGDMNFVGPRPALFNQEDLIILRKEKEVDRLTPGITGWAQVNGRDELSIPDKVDFDIEYMRRRSFLFDIRILWMTFSKIVARDGVSH